MENLLESILTKAGPEWLLILALLYGLWTVYRRQSELFDRMVKTQMQLAAISQSQRDKLGQLVEVIERLAQIVERCPGTRRVDP